MSDSSKSRVVGAAETVAADAIGVGEVAAAARVAGRFIPRRKKSAPEGPPNVMTWGRALPVLIVAFVFWLLRIVFEMFWFFGPALIAVGCTLGTNSALNTTTAGVLGKTVAATCTGVAALLGYFGAPIIEALGVVMAMAVGFMGWLFVGGIIFLTNRRVFSEGSTAALWLIGGLGISEIPLIGNLPGILGATVKIYHAQIKQDKLALKKYNEKMVALRNEEQQEQIAQITQIRTAQQLQEQSEAANEALYETENQKEEEEFADYTQEYKEAA